MKKIFGILVCVSFMLIACDKANAEKKVEANSMGKPVTEAPVARSALVPSENANARVITIDWAKAIEMQKAGSVLIDVRTPSEVAEGAVAGAINIPLQEVEQRLAEFSKDKDLLIYCRSGKRSMAVSNFLIQHGYSRVFNVDGGILAYQKQ